MAEGVAANQEPDIFDSVELDGLLQGFDCNSFLNLDLDIFSEPWVPGSDSLPHVIQVSDSASPETCLERFQLDEAGVGHEDGVDGFFSGVLVDVSDRGKMEAETPLAYDVEGKDEKGVGVTAVAGDEDDDSIGKKLRRKMRNKESAMNSRERKKAYVKDLEMKSKYLESECHRLDYVLRCCLAENMVLHHSLQFQERLYGASMAKQESAVLFVESLLLVSLFWFMSILCLFLVPNLKVLSRQGRRGLALRIVEVKSTRSEKLRPDSQLQFASFSRRYRGLRVRMKLFFISYSCLSRLV